MKRLAFAVTILVGGIGFFHWLSRGFATTWEPAFRGYMESTASREAGARVHIDSIAPAFFHRIRLTNVRITDFKGAEPPIFQANEIELTISLIDLPRAIWHRHAYEAIGLVSVKSPWLRLSHETMSRWGDAHTEAHSLPPWFTLAWEGGTIQWLDPRAPHGSWTIYQTHGIFRIRGPQMNFALKGSVEQARSIRLQMGSLGKRWNAQMTLSDAECPGVLALAETLRQKPILPKAWSVRGKFNLQAEASGHHWPAHGGDWLAFLNKASLTFFPGPMAQKSEEHLVTVAGTLAYKKGKIMSPHLEVDCPWFQVAGRVEMALDEVRKNLDRPFPGLTLSAVFPAGRLGHWPFQNAALHTRYVNDHWEFLENTVHFLDGQITAKGYISPVSSDLAITADNISLAALGFEHAANPIHGRLNASCNLRGPLEEWILSGAWRLGGVQWGQSMITDARGDFEVTADHFHAQAKSQNSQFRFISAGSLSRQNLMLDRLEIDLPSGASLNAEGIVVRATQQVHGTVDIANVAFPADLPFLPFQRISLNGPLDAHGRISGSLAEPTLKAAVHSTNVIMAKQSMGKAVGAILWKKNHFEIPTFHLDAGVEGRFAMDRILPKAPSWSLDLSFNQAPAILLGAFSARPFITEGKLNGHVHAERSQDLSGSGLLTLKNAAVGKWTNLESSLHFELKRDRIQITQFSAENQVASAQWTGRATWAKDAFPPGHMTFDGHGQIRSIPDPAAWNIPLDATGQCDSAMHGWSGQARFYAHQPRLRNIPTDPLEAQIQWDSTHLTWTHAHWGRHWMSQGNIEWEKSPAVWAAQVKADHVPLEEWHPLLWPKSKNEFHGILSGTFNLTGETQDPQGSLSLHLDNARWRAFQFTSDLEGHWSHKGIEPLTLKGHFNTGGDFVFTGLLTSDEKAQGTLKLTGFELRPLGESLGFPKPVEGLTAATLTVGGPLTRLTSSGHLDSGPVIYGKAAERPFRLEQVTMDMILAPSETDPTVEHLTLTEAQIKTTEELVRLKAGSFVEFAGRKPALLKLGTELRNLHLGLFTLFGGLDLDGTWQIKPEGFALDTKAHTHSLFINDYELEEGLVLGNYYNGVLKFPAPQGGPALVTGTIDFHHAPQLKFSDLFISGKDQEGLRLSGDIGPELWDFQMVGRGLDIGTLGELAGFPYPLSGNTDVKIRGTGDPAHPHVEGSVELNHGTALGLEFQSGTAAFIWQDTRISFTKIALTNPGHYRLDGAGSFPLLPKEKSSTKDHSIDFSIHLKDSNLSLLQSFSREVKSAKGPVEGLLQIKGTVEDPSLHGSLRVTNGTVVGAHYFRQLSNGVLALDFDGDTITIKELRGKSGEGEFRGSGTITLAGFQPSKYDLKMEVVSPKGVEVQVPELAIPESPLAKRFRFLTTASRCDVRGHVSLRGPAEAPVFSGVGIFSNGHFTFPPSRKNPPPAPVMDWFRRITWDVDLKFLDGAWFDNELVQATVLGTLKLKGPSDKLRVDGGLDINEGKISYLGLQFDVRQARYDVRSETRGEAVINTPYLRGEAESQIQAVDTVSGVAGSAGGSRLSVNDVITLNIDYAPVDEIKPRLTSASNPTLSQEKLLARVTQTDVQNLTPQERTYLYQKQILSLIDNSLTTPLAQNVLKKTGIADRVRVQHVFDPNSVAAQDLNSATASQQQSQAVSLFANTKYTIEKDLSNKLSLGYGVRLVQTAGLDPVLQQQQKLDLVSDVQLSYRWFRNIYLRGDFELPSSNPNILPERKVTIEPRWRFGWWGNTNREKKKSTPGQ